MSIERRLRRLEGEKAPPAETGANGETMPGYDVFFEMQMEWTALHLIQGLEPDFTLDEAGAFITPDGRFAVGRRRMDLRGLMGPRTEEILKEMANSPERWCRFLAEDDEAEDLLGRLLELAEAADVPEGYREPGHRWHDLGEINERIGDPHNVGGSVFSSAEEREATRRLTWTLLNDPEGASMLSEVTRRRDAFLARGARDDL